MTDEELKAKYPDAMVECAHAALICGPTVISSIRQMLNCADAWREKNMPQKRGTFTDEDVLVAHGGYYGTSSIATKTGIRDMRAALTAIGLRYVPKPKELWCNGVKLRNVVTEKPKDWGAYFYADPIGEDNHGKCYWHDSDSCQLLLRNNMVHSDAESAAEHGRAMLITTEKGT